MSLSLIKKICVTTFILFSACSQNTNTTDLSIPADQGKVNYQPITPIEWKMSNGLTVVFQEDNELPIIRGSLLIPGGTLWEYDSKVGLVAAMGQQMRQGGAGSNSADQLDRVLEKLAASISSEYSGEYGSVGFSSLTSDFEEILSIFTDVLLRPRFDQDRLDLWKGQALESIRRRSDDPSIIASLSYKELVMGPTPFGRVMTENDLRAISRIDLLRAHRRYVRPDGAYLVIVGKINRAEVEKYINKYLAGWESRKVDLGPPPEFNNINSPGIYFIKQPFTQSTVYMGHPGPKRLEPDHVAIEAFNSIFGEAGFGSRLMVRIRTDLGLVYSISGGLQPGFQVGQAIIGLKTKAESSAQAIVESFKVLRGLQSEIPSKDELERAKKSIQNSFIFRLDTPDDAARRYALIRLLNYPHDYDNTFVNRVLSITGEDIEKVALNRWHPERFTIVVVGNEIALNSLKEGLAQDPEEFYNLKLKVCEFKYRLGACTEE